MNATSMNESRDKRVAHFQCKNPVHSNRTELADRVMAHLNQATTKKNNNFTVHVAQVKVGEMAVETILEKHPLPHLELIHHSWKHKHKDEFDQRMKQHAMMCQESRAYKLQGMDPTNTLLLFMDAMLLGEAGIHIVDICTATQTHKTRTVYV